jgi:hypothetical protein
MRNNFMLSLRSWWCGVFVVVGVKMFDRERVKLVVFMICVDLLYFLVLLFFMERLTKEGGF